MLFRSMLINVLSNRLLIGELDEALDKAVDLSKVRADPIAPIRY